MFERFFLKNHIDKFDGIIYKDILLLYLSTELIKIALNAVLSPYLRSTNSTYTTCCTLNPLFNFDELIFVEEILVRTLF